jgi:hypothetical protein
MTDRAVIILSARSRALSSNRAIIQIAQIAGVLRRTSLSEGGLNNDLESEGLFIGI